VHESPNVHAEFVKVGAKTRDEYSEKSIQEHDAAGLAKFVNEKATSAREN
jgi:hypothetical protein